MSAGDAFERFLAALVELDLVPPRVGIEAAWGGRRIRSEFGDFAGHVPYTPGDDLRFLDWNALARTGHRVLRRFDEIEHQALELYVDLSASLAHRLDGVAMLAQVFVFVALHRLDSVELTLLAERGPERLHLEGPAAWPRARRALGELRASGTRGLRDLPDALADKPRGAGRVVVSDFQPVRPCQEVLSRCALAGQRLVCVFPRLPIEAGSLDLADGPYRLRDPESGRVLELTMTGAVRRAFAAEQRAWERRTDLSFRALGHRLVAATLPDAARATRVESWIPFLVPRRRR